MKFLPVVSACLLAAGVASPAASQPAATRYRDVVFTDVSMTGNIAFRQAVNASGTTETLTLDIYQPAADPERRRPAIVWIHGGGFRPGNDKRQKYIVTIATEFAKRGFVSVSPDYRVRSELGQDRLPALRDALDDCRAALAWLRAHADEYGVDASRIAVGGGSAGGMVAVNLAAVEGRTSGGSGVFALIDLWGSPAAALRILPIAPRYPPAILIHGTADQLVPFAQSEALAAELAASGVTHELRAIPGAPHTPTAAMADILEWTAAFVYRALTEK